MNAPQLSSNSDAAFTICCGCSFYNPWWQYVLAFPVPMWHLPDSDCGVHLKAFKQRRCDNDQHVCN